MGKGQNFEREICKKLSLWWSSGKSDAIFWRTSGSGARATVRMRKNKTTTCSAGDLACLNSLGQPFIESCLIEIKRGYKDRINVLSAVDKLKSQKQPVLIDWWLKAQKERKEHQRKYSFIIFKRDRKEECIMFAERTYYQLKKRNMNLPLRLPMIYVKYEFHELMIIKLDDFLLWASPSSFRQRRMIKRRKI